MRSRWQNFPRGGEPVPEHDWWNGVSWAKKERCQWNAKFREQHVRGRAAWNHLPHLWNSKLFGVAAEKGINRSGQISQEKEARTRLFWASFTVFYFPSKEHFSDTVRIHLRKRPGVLTLTINNLESRLLRAYMGIMHQMWSLQATRWWTVVMLWLETKHLQICIYLLNVYGKADSLSSVRIIEKASLLGSEPKPG